MKKEIDKLSKRIHAVDSLTDSIANSFWGLFSSFEWNEKAVKVLKDVQIKVEKAKIHSSYTVELLNEISDKMENQLKRERIRKNKKR